MDEPVRTGSSRAVQGCLFGAVALFVFLLLVMVFLAYQRFRERPTTEVPGVSGRLSAPVVVAGVAVPAPGTPGGLPTPLATRTPPAAHA